MEYNTKSILLDENHFKTVIEKANYTHEIFSDFKNSTFAEKFDKQPFPGQYLLFLAGGLAESYDKLYKDIYALSEISEVKFFKPALLDDEIYLNAKETEKSKDSYYFDWKIINQNKELLLFSKVKFIRNKERR